MTGAEAIVASLEALGVTDVFGMPGGAILPTYDPPDGVDGNSSHFGST